MSGRFAKFLKRRWGALALIVLLAGYWLLPISGQVVVSPDRQPKAAVWPQVHLEPRSGGDQRVRASITDRFPWGHVHLTVNGQVATWDGATANPDGTWTWRWTFQPPSGWPDTSETILVFYRDCATGCIERVRFTVGGDPSRADPVATDQRLPTKLGVVFADPQRDWHGRAGWDVELTYARLPDEPRWGIDDLAARVQAATATGLLVLVRVDYDRGQSVPPADDHLAVTEYLRYIRRLARDDRMKDVYGFIIGSGFDSMGLMPTKPRPAGR